MLQWANCRVQCEKSYTFSHINYNMSLLSPNMIKQYCTAIAFDDIYHFLMSLVNIDDHHKMTSDNLSVGGTDKWNTSIPDVNYEVFSCNTHAPRWKC